MLFGTLLHCNLVYLPILEVGGNTTCPRPTVVVDFVHGLKHGPHCSLTILPVCNDHRCNIAFYMVDVHLTSYPADTEADHRFIFDCSCTHRPCLSTARFLSMCKRYGIRLHVILPASTKVCQRQHWGIFLLIRWPPVALARSGNYSTMVSLTPRYPTIAVAIQC